MARRPAERKQTASRLELGWPGKAAAFERSHTSAAALSITERVRTGQPTITFTNQLVHGDNLGVLAALADGPLRKEIEAAGGIRLIYLDPPFATGDQFHMDVRVGEAATTLRLPAYRDAWDNGLSGYLSMLAPRLQLLHDRLADDGSLYFHCDYRASAAVRLLLDEIFGPDRLLNEIIWTYGLGNANSRRAFGRKHDTILLYTKTDDYIFNLQRGPMTPAMEAKYRHTRPDGSRFMRSYGKEYDLQGGKPVGSVWDIPALAATSKERNGYPTQKPEALLERIIAVSSNPGDLVLDPFCGAGTTLAVAERLSRHWIGCDAGRLAVWTTRKRLAGGANFDVMASAGVETSPSLPVDYSLRPVVSIEYAEHGPLVRLQRLDVEATSSASRAWSQLAVEDGLLIRYALAKTGEREREPVTAHWSDWLDGWAVGTGGSRDQPFTALWETRRTRYDRFLPLISGPIPRLATAPGAVTIRATDFNGRAWMCNTSVASQVHKDMEGRDHGNRLADPRR